MIYKELLYYEQIRINSELPMASRSQQNGVWLQHSPRNNPLAILAVNWEAYEEGRRIFLWVKQIHL